MLEPIKRAAAALRGKIVCLAERRLDASRLSSATVGWSVRSARLAGEWHAVLGQDGRGRCAESESIRRAYDLAMTYALYAWGDFLGEVGWTGIRVGSTTRCCGASGTWSAKR